MATTTTQTQAGAKAQGPARMAPPATSARAAKVGRRYYPYWFFLRRR